MGILGPSGAGKSTLFNMITMSINRSEGDISLEGQNFQNKNVSEKLWNCEIGIVY
jgi:ABC-type multidrug transport system ATPase subunit